MACPLTGRLYKAPPRNPCLEENYSDCNAQVSSDAAISSKAHRCVEQTCQSIGSCLMQPCESIRPVPALPKLLTLVRSCQDALPNDTLLCAFLNLDDYQLYYESYAASSGVDDCWKGMAKTLTNPDPYSSMRVWEQVGYTQPESAKAALQAYQEAYELVVQDSAAGAM